jgi:protein-S-isoprenylcysteine O-methyltransferase Ste14
MSELLTPEGSLALAIAVLELVLGYRFTLPERGRDIGGFLTYAVAVGLGFVAGRGLLPAFPSLPAPLSVRVVGAALLLVGLFLAGASLKARLLAGRGRLVTGGPYARVRHPLYLGLSLVLAGALLRGPSAVGALAAALAVAQYVSLGVLEERDSLRTFGVAWSDYASRTRAVLPLARRSGSSRGAGGNGH